MNPSRYEKRQNEIMTSVARNATWDEGSSWAPELGEHTVWVQKATVALLPLVSAICLPQSRSLQVGLGAPHTPACSFLL